MRRALALVAAAVALGGCAKETTVREQDLVAAGGLATAPEPRDASARSDDRPVRIAVVTHGQASSSFWSIVRNGVEAASRQFDVTVSYRSPDTFSTDRMSALIDEAIRSRPDGLVVSLPGPEVAGAVRRAVDGGIPVVSINSGSELSEQLGLLAHVGQPEERAGYAAGERLLDAGVERALCVNQERDNVGLGDRCRGLARAMRAGGARSRVVYVDDQDPPLTVRRVRAAIERHRIDGVQALNNDGAMQVLEAVGGVSQRRIVVGAFDMSPEVLAAVRQERIRFTIDQQPYLQGFLPVAFLAQYARYGLFPEQGEVVATGPNFVTADNADQAIRLSERGIR